MTDEEPDTLSLISFTYIYAGHGWAHAAISDGVITYDMDPSYVPYDPLFVLVAAVDKVLTYGGESECTWDYEPAADRWILRRDGDRLHITIRGVGNGFLRRSWPPERGDLYFSATCDLWKFAAKVRLAVSRLEPAGGEYHDPMWVQGTPEYGALCTFLDEHKRAQRSSSAKSKRG